MEMQEVPIENGLSKIHMADGHDTKIFKWQ